MSTITLSHLIGRYLFPVVLFALAPNFAFGQPDVSRLRTVIIILDGLRPDYINESLTPNLFRLKQRGCYGSAHHSVYPTVTRVNASSYITGSYPSTHGLLGNAVYFPQVDSSVALNTGDITQLVLIQQKIPEPLLQARSLGEILSDAGRHMIVFSSGSSGQAYLQNHSLQSGGIVHPEIILPDSLREKMYVDPGLAPPSAEPNTAQHTWITRAWLRHALARGGPTVTAVWYSDPDGTAHSRGIGHPEANRAIRFVDSQVGVILRAIESQRDLEFNIIVTADHGFVTYLGEQNIQDMLISEGLKRDERSSDVVLAGTAIYVQDHDSLRVREIAAALQEHPSIGAVFSAASPKDSARGWVPGTLSFNSIHWDHTDRAADLLFDYRWTDEPNAFGFPGSSYAAGTAGHGGSSPYEIHIPLIAAGPGFKRKYQSSAPSSNVDIVPTILSLHKFSQPQEMQGRALTEFLKEPRKTSDNSKARTEEVRTMATFKWGTYELMLHRTWFGDKFYVDFTRVVRKNH